MNVIPSKEQQLYHQLYKEITSLNGSIMNLGQLLFYAAQKYPQNTALVYQERTVTYQQLFYYASRFARTLQEKGVKPRDRVLLFFENSIEFYVGYYAIVQSGAVVTPLNTFLKERELAHIINDAQPTLMVASQTLLDKLMQEHIDAHVPVITEAQMDITGPVDKTFLAAVPAYLEPDQMAALLYTSGTTGLPKGVMLSSKNILTNCIQTLARFGLVEEERVFGVLPFFHSFAQNICVWQTLLAGCTVIIVARIERRYILEGLQHKPTVFVGIPALFGLMCLLKNADLGSVKYFASGGDAMPDRIRGGFELIYQRKIGAGYGLSETSPVLTADLQDITEPTDSVGSPLMGVSIQLRDEQGELLAPGRIGQIWVKGDNIMLGYYNDPQKTAQTIQKGWLDTGDLGYFNGRGKLIVTGRVKDIIINKGFKIYPQEIENVIQMDPDVIRVGVIGEPDEAAGEVAVAYVQIRTEVPGIEGRLRALCERQLAAYKVPRKFICSTQQLPITGTGKVDKKVLRKK